MHYFLTNQLEYNFSGIEHAQVYRHNLFNKLGVESQIVTFEYIPALYIFIKRQRLSADISLNMFDFWQGAVHKGKINNKKYIDTVNNLSQNQKIEYFPFQLLDNRNLDNQIKKIDFFDENQNLIKTEYFDIRGFLSKLSIYDGAGNLIKNEWLNINGEIVVIENCVDGTISLTKINPQYDHFSMKNNFTSWNELKSAWLDFLVKKDKMPVLYIDRGEYVSPIVIGMTNHAMKKFVVLHSAHTVDRQKPYSSPLNDIRQLEYDNYNLWSGYIAATEEQAKDYEIRTKIPTFEIPVSYALEIENINSKSTNSNMKHIVYFSRISREKRIEDAIEAMAYVIKQNNNIDLKIYGYVTDSLYNEELHQLIDELSLQNNVYLLPYNPDRGSLLKNADLFLLTSEYEGFNMSMIEASSYGLPLVSYNVKYGPKTIINSLQNGYLVESGNIKSLAEKITTILSNKKIYDTFRENGLRLIYKKFGFTTILQKWKQFFRDNDIEFYSKNLYVVTGSFEENTALKPANLGLKEIAEEQGFISIKYPNDSNKIKEFVKSFYPGDKVLLSYPSFIWTMPTHLKYDLDIVQQLKNKGIIVYLFLNDSLILRELSEFMDNEFEILNIVDFILVPSIEMKKALSEIGIKSEFSKPFGLYPLPEYLSNISYLDRKLNKSSKQILYAGNLAKAQFLEQIKCPFSFEVYGPNPSKLLLNNDYISYKGNLSIENLSEKMKNYTGFGLVWDGEYRGGFSKYSRYTRYNMPYKASHYLQNGIPIIAWSGSSLGQFIKKNNIGIVINSLDDLSQAILTLTDKDIKLYKENIVNFNKIILNKKNTLINILTEITVD
ncbi:Glycosyltransferase involved in cell wall bisynthesis (RfaB) [Fructobacillus cardui]|uniref:Glycosyltransferase involved in cell wall bisynthesis (RfaB) n=2 Tax=Fructobacillus cardui TaxID=2893170 RepID=A0ABM9N2E0_9LACO|nr:Glycosyltransferase involved in cell wall bisynthesis (RfaB) [Fructobacillus cardui]